MVLIFLIFPQFLFPQQKKSSIDSLIAIANTISQNDPARAERFCDSLINTVFRKSPGEGLYLMLAQKAKIIEQQGRFNDAIKLNLEALAMNDKRISVDQRGGVTNNVGRLFYQMGVYNKALDYHFKALKIFEFLKDSTAMAQGYNNIGNVYAEQHNYENSIKYYNRSLGICQNIKNDFGVALSLLNMGALHADKGKYALAQECYDKCLPLAKKIKNDEIEMACKLNMGLVEVNIGKIEIAEQLYREAMTYYKGKGDEFTVIFAYVGLGEIAQKRKKYEEALDYFNIALKLAGKAESLDEIRNAYDFISQTYELKGDYRNSLVNYKLFSKIKDSLVNIEQTRESTRKEVGYDFEKIAYADSIKRMEEDHIKDLEDEAIRLNHEKELSSQRSIIIITIVVIFLMGVVTFILVKSNKQKQKDNMIILSQKAEVERQKAEVQNQKEVVELKNHVIEEKQREIIDSINYAERIQRSFIATKEILDENLREYFVFFKPKDIVSGDFYWASKLTNGNFALATADSTGHGVPGAIMSLLNVTSLEKAIETQVQPSRILDYTRKTIIERLKKDGTVDGGKDGMDVSLTVYDFARNKLIVACANNPVWIARGAEMMEIKPDKIPVGKHDRDSVPFSQQEIDLHANDVVYTLTDGFPDQFGGLRGKKFMSKNLKELLISNAHLPMEEQKAILEFTFKSWVGDLEQVDDVTLIGVRI
jgi:serine phosphatase RsbU (regulator of sigma subunit)/Tfp pilus assembly protein PilF